MLTQNCKITEAQNLSDIELAIKPEYLSYIKVVSLSQNEIDARAENKTPINETEIYQAFEFSGNFQIMLMNETRR